METGNGMIKGGEREKERKRVTVCACPILG